MKTLPMIKATPSPLMKSARSIGIVRNDRVDIGSAMSRLPTTSNNRAFLFILSINYSCENSRLFLSFQRATAKWGMGEGCAALQCVLMLGWAMYDLEPGQVLIIECITTGQ